MENSPEETLQLASGVIETLLDQVTAAERYAENWKETASQFLDSANYYRNLLDQIAEHLGEAPFISDDGSVQDSPIYATLPDLMSNISTSTRYMRTLLNTTGEDDQPLRTEEKLRAAMDVVKEAVRVVAADTYKHPVLSRDEAVRQGVAGLHDAVEEWNGLQTAGCYNAE